MKNRVILFGFASIMLLTKLHAQATGNVIYNSNNRFFQNNTYKETAGKKYRSSEAYSNNTYNYTSATHNDFTISTFNQSSNEVIININVLYNAKPSGYMAIFHMNQSGKKISDLDTQVNKKVNKFKEMAKAAGIGPENFYIDMIALVPIFEQGKRANKPKGFELQKNLHVKYTNANDLDKLFSMAAQCEIYDLIKVEYLYDFAEKAGKELHAKALQLMQDKMASYKTMGVKLDTAQRSIYESGNVFFPIDKYKSYTPLAVSSLEEEDKPADDKGELMKTHAGFIQRTTVFYNPTDCSGYDAVINPSPLEPPIQFTYSLQIRYKITPDVRVIDNSKTIKTTELMIITPQGEIKEIKK